MLSGEYCKFFKKTNFEEQLQVAASELLKRTYLAQTFYILIIQTVYIQVIPFQAIPFHTIRIQAICFPVKFAKFFRTPFLENTSGGCFCHQNRLKETKNIF